MDSLALGADLEPEPVVDEHSTVTLFVNGEETTLTVDHRATVLETLRESFGLTGAKKGCDHGQCGACTVLVDERRVNSCLLLTVTQDGAVITTVEGLAEGESLHPVQQAFVEQGRPPVRLLHPRPDLLGRGRAPRGRRRAPLARHRAGRRDRAGRTRRRRDPGTHERQPVPVRGLPRIVEAIEDVIE